MSENNDKDPQPPVSIKVSAKAEFKGEVSTRVADRAVEALVDVISPFTEGLGLVGDNIRAHRYDVAIKIAQRAQELAVEKNILVLPPPLKFTVPFLEKASIEDPDSELSELWARLLLDASNEFQGIQLTYIQILSEISSAEAIFLANVASAWDPDYSLQHSSSIATEIADTLENAVLDFEHTPLQNASFVSRETAKELIDASYSVEHEKPAVLITVSIPYQNPDSTSKMPDGEATLHNQATIAYLLQRQNMVAIENFEIHTKVGRVSIEVACLTQLGSDFVLSCMDGSDYFRPSE